MQCSQDQILEGGLKFGFVFLSIINSKLIGFSICPFSSYWFFCYCSCLIAGFLAFWILFSSYVFLASSYLAASKLFLLKTNSNHRHNILFYFINTINSAEHQTGYWVGSIPFPSKGPSKVKQGYVVNSYAWTVQRKVTLATKPSQESL